MSEVEHMITAGGTHPFLMRYVKMIGKGGKRIYSGGIMAILMMK